MRIKNEELRIKNYTQKGQSMFEVVIAMFIISMIIVGIVSVSVNSVSNSIFSRNKTLAGKFSQEAIEWIRGEREKNITTFLTYIQTSTYCLQTLSWANTGTCGGGEVISGTIFRREVIFNSNIISGKRIVQADVKTYWNDSKGYHEAKSVTNFSDIREK